MQSRGLPEDGRAGMHRWHIRRRLDGGRTEGLSAGFAISAIAAIAVLVLSCGDGAVEPTPPPPAPVATTVTVSPAFATLTSLEETAPFTAEVRDQNGQVMAGAAVAWASSDPSVASVAASGLVTAVANGTATITARSGSVSGTAAVTVAQVVSAVAVSPSADTLVALGDTVRLVAEATDANGHGVAAVTEFMWSSSDTLVAQVNESGLVKSVAEGEAAVTATAADVTGGAELTVVSPLPTTIAVSRDTVAFTALGQTVQLAVEVREQAGRVMAEALVSWSSGDTLVAVVDSAGLVTAVGGGATTVTVAAGDVWETVVVTVTQSAGSVVVSPSEATIGVGDTLRLAAEGFDENGHAVERAVFSWSSSDVGVARVDESGLVEALAEGAVRIRATAGDVSGVAEITIENPDRAALVALYEATDGPNWVNNDNWLTDAPLGDWYGVDTDASGRVVLLLLPENRLTGTIPPDLGNLTDLTGLSFWANQLWGTIPPELGRLVSLRRLSLGVNDLTGEMPPELGALTRLTGLTLRINQLTGPIPTELGNLTELRELDLYRNELSGPIPTELGNLTELQILTLGLNQLTGQIPEELANLGKLRHLYLASSGLTGPIPPELGNLVDLESLSLWGNNLTGPIPPELGNLTKLEGLSLSSNDLTGPIPPELGNLVNLFSASFGGNRLTGAVPRSFLQLDSLQTLGCAQSDGVCVPATAEFREWVREVEARSVGSSWVDIPWCDETEKLVLEALYDAASGPEWTLSDGWLENEDLAHWYGVSTDSVTGRISGLDLTRNGLSGGLPQALGQLVGMTEFQIGDNELSGWLPLSLAALPLDEFDYSGTSLCVEDDGDFESWLAGIAIHRGTGVQCPPLTERDILGLLYRNMGGSSWGEHGGWLTDAPLSEWHGVETDASGRVVALSLRGNRLTGSIPAELGQLGELRSLDLSYNRLSGEMPPELGDLDPLERLDLRGNRLTGALPVELGELSELKELRLNSNRLSGSIPVELGNLVRLEWLILEWNELSGQIPVELGRLSQLRGLRLAHNQLSRSIPVELGDLSRLEYLDLSQNQLSGEIPEQFGKLGELRILRLYDNRLTGSIPSGVANLARLERLDLSHNRLTGLIPSGLGDLTNLTELHLGDNQLGGSLPVALGRAGSLESLDLRSNALAGPIPPEYSNLTGLKSLIVTYNPDLAGPLPEGLSALSRVERFMAGGTGLCLPTDSGLVAWFGAIADGYVAHCREGPSVYLTQATQSWDHPVPLLAGEPALLRVFVTAPSGSAVTMPDVTATFHVDGTERHIVHIPARAQIIPAEVDEGDLARSVNAEIPAEVIAPGLEMVIEVDPGGALDPALGVTKRIPESGRLPVDVRAVSPFQLTLIPFLWDGVADSSVVQSVNEMAADASGGHESFRDVRTLLPVAEMAVTAHEPVSMSHSNANELLAQIEAMRLMEGGSGYWMGVAKRRPGARSFWRPGVAQVGGHVSYARPHAAATMAHELGHNLGLLHAPCGNPGGVDPWFPSSEGRIGAWGFDLERYALVPPITPDLMSYCGSGNEWIGNYHFNKTLAHRLANDDAAAAARAAGTDPVRAILLWGGRDEDGVPYLDPAFVVDAAPSAPAAGGEYTIEGTTADGTPVFTFAFDMARIGDPEGEETSFVFALPVQADWAGLARITLSGPGGSVTLDDSTDRPMAILRDPQTGQVRAFLRDPAPATQAAADAVGGATGVGLETLFSRGIPGADAWRR